MSAHTSGSKHVLREIRCMRLLGTHVSVVSIASLRCSLSLRFLPATPLVSMLQCTIVGLGSRGPRFAVAVFAMARARERGRPYFGKLADR
jgi:hypothetical protein